MGLLLPDIVNNWRIAYQVFFLFFLLNYIESAKNVEYQIAVAMMALFMAIREEIELPIGYPLDPQHLMRKF